MAAGDVAHAVVPAQAVVLQPVAGVGAPLVGEAVQARGDVVVVRRDHAALARGDLLVRVEGEDRRVAVGAHDAALAARAERLGGVLDDRDAVPRGDGVELLDPARQAEDVHRHDGPGARGDRRLDGRGIEVEGRGVDVREDGLRPLVERAVGRRDERERARDHLVARAGAGEPHAEVQAGGAAGDGDGVAGADGRGERLLELAQHRAERELAGAQHLEDELLLARPQVGARERDGRLHRHGIWSASCIAPLPSDAVGMVAGAGEAPDQPCPTARRPSPCRAPAPGCRPGRSRRPGTR